MYLIIIILLKSIYPFLNNCYNMFNGINNKSLIQILIFVMVYFKAKISYFSICIKIIISKILSKIFLDNIF